MWRSNALTERLNLKYPKFQAPMGGITTPALASAVSNFGGLGMWDFSAPDARRRSEGFRQQNGGALNVNYPLWEDAGDLEGVGVAMRERLQTFYDEKGLGTIAAPVASAGGVTEEHLEVLLSSKPEVVIFHFGLPSEEIVNTLKEAGIFVICSATTVAEATLLEAGGVDAVIAQGIEAGGHRGTFTGVDVSMQPGLFALLPQVVDAVTVPVVAAGAICDGRTLSAARILGASAVQMGTAFLKCDEANLSPGHRLGLETSDDASSIVTDVASGRPARVAANRLIQELSGETPLPFPAQLGLTNPLGSIETSGLPVVFAGQAVAAS